MSDRPFLVSVHDASPQHSAELQTITRALSSRIGNAYHLAIVPRPGGQHYPDAAWTDWTPEENPALLIHGWHHQRPKNLQPISAVNYFRDEWHALTPQALQAQVVAARREITRLFGRPPKGVVAPCWRWGAFSEQLLAQQEIYALGFRRAWSESRCLPIRTSSWDWGAASRLHPLLSRPPLPGIPSIVIHPADLRRGVFHKALAAIEGLLAAGAVPVQAGALLAA